MRILSLFLIGMVLLSGCKKDPPKPPAKALLTLPAKNSECTPVQSSSGNSSIVSFSWQMANHTEIYELRVKNLNTGTTQTKSTKNTTETLPLEKGAPFSWVVVSKNSQTTTAVSSESWLFYNPGSQASHAPFPAEIVSPQPGASVFMDINNEITMEWSGADIDNDIESYKVYFSTESPPTTLISSLSVDDTSQKVSVISGTVYYWKVVTEDATGNTSDTGILDFKVY